MRKPWRRFEIAELRQLWALWKQGETSEAIGGMLGRPQGSVYAVLARHGGVAPRERRRALRSLSLPDREEISRRLATGASIRAMARELRRAPSTISREI